MYTYICIYVYICIYICNICIYIYIYIYIYMYSTFQLFPDVCLRCYFLIQYVEVPVPKQT